MKVLASPSSSLKPFPKDCPRPGAATVGRPDQGVALVITLVMLSVVTFMAVTFLAVSRRERAAVTVVEEQNRARQMAEIAVARVQAEIVSRVISSSNLLSAAFMVSTNYFNPPGFNPTLPLNQAAPTNVNYDYLSSGGSVTGNDDAWLRNIGNLLYDPRAPVFVRTNQDPAAPLDFRYSLDLNRNQRFDSNGLLPILDNAGRWIQVPPPPPQQGTLVLSNFFVGDPEWIGVLQQPELVHGATNRFVGRMAYVLQPAGRSLDLNYIGNHALDVARDPTLQTDGYYRNQGVGSWELNLAAFLRDLNTNVTRQYSYLVDTNTGLSRPSSSEAARDALAFLRYRYDGNVTNLLSVQALYGNAGANAFLGDRVDGYTDGPRFGATNLAGLATENDLPTRPWVGADNPNVYVELQELFDTNKVVGSGGGGQPSWPGRLLLAQTGLSTYDRYTFYRMLGQMGTESSPPGSGKINLHYVDLPGFAPTNFVSWHDTDLRDGNSARRIPAFGRPGSEMFFEAAVNRLLVAARRTNIVTDNSGRRWTNYYIGDARIRPDLSVTNILLHPFNEYSPELHRLMQLALNIYDSTTNRPVARPPHLPTVMRPLFDGDGESIWIKGYEELTNAAGLTATFIPVRNLGVQADRDVLAAGREPRAIVYNVPFVIGAKKGLPNFNEFSLRNVAMLTRKLEVRKRTPLDLQPYQTNLLYLVTVTNQFGVELWNSYLTPTNYPRQLRIRVLGRLSLSLIDGLRTNLPLALTNINYSADLSTNNWRSNAFILPVHSPAVLASTAAYRPLPTPTLIPAGTNTPFVPGLGFYMPDWVLHATNNLICAIIDEPTQRLVDFVSLGDLRTIMNISQELMGRQNLSATGALDEPLDTWDTNRVAGGTSIHSPMVGVENQMQISLGNTPVSEAQWRSYSQLTAEGLDKPKSIDRFRIFCGLTPLVYTTDRERQQLRAELGTRLYVQAPYSPTRKLYQDTTWQANDPLVHYLATDLLDPLNRPDDPTRTNTVNFAIPPTATLTNSNLGLVNQRYAPWGGNPSLTPSLTAYDNRLKDPGVYGSDDWEFPTNQWPNLGWIGRVHRGTPWQTVYLKSGTMPVREWTRWAGNPGTHPTNDWPLLEAFTVNNGENAGRGLLSVNQDGLAAWSAVLSGLSVLSNVTPAVVRHGTAPEFVELFIQPDGLDLAGNWHPQLRRIVDGINRTRALEVVNNRQTVPVFNRLGRILGTPELTVASPFINPSNLVTDAVLERIPQQILSLLKEDEPRYVIYAFGQALREAPNSLYLGSGVFNRLCTNYQVTAEFAAKAVIRIEGLPTAPRAVVESFQELPVQ